MRTGYAIELEVGGCPGEGDAIAGDAVEDFEVGMLFVSCGVEVLVLVHESGTCVSGLKCLGWKSWR